MSLPTDICLLRFYYPIGNTPGVCLTRHLTPEIDARILLIGSGDLRNVLFTCYADGAPNRSMDITLCDYEPGVVARNILLLSLILDGESDPVLWDLYYHFRVTSRNLQILNSHAKKLSELATSDETWKTGPLGWLVDIPIPSTLAALKKLWSRWADESTSARCRDQRRLEAAVKKAAGDRMAEVPTMGLSSLLPCMSSSAIDGLLGDNKKYWRNGTTDLSQGSNGSGKANCVNPTFFASDGSTFTHYASDPVIGFHIATSCTAIAKDSPLTGGATLVDAAKQEFAACVEAFKSRLQTAKVVFRFTIADALAFCRLLQSRTTPFDHRLASFVDHWQFEHLTLPKDCSIPDSFNVIDTSNLIDHLGGLNLLVATSPLLERSASAALYTELLVAQSDGGPDIISKAVHGDANTVAVLFGLFPVEHHTNSTVSSTAILAMLLKESSAGDTRLVGNKRQTQLRMTWRRAPGHDRGEAITPLKITSQDLAGILYETYKQMFASEDPTRRMRALVMGDKVDACSRSFTREAWIGYIACVKANVDTDWAATMDHLMNLIYDDTSTNMTLNNIQDVHVYMHLYGLYSTDELKTPPAAMTRDRLGPGLDPRAALPGLTSMPSVVCITMGIPRSKLSIFTKMDPKNLGTPSIQCYTEANKSSPFSQNNWQNIHSVVQAGFGDIKTSGPGISHGPINVIHDSTGWSGCSPLVVSFLVPTWVLLRRPDKVRVKLGLYSNPHTATTFVHNLGLELAIHDTTLDDKGVYISAAWPNWAKNVDATVQPKQPAAASPESGEFSHTTTAKATPSRDKIGCLINRVDIGPGAHRDALQAKAAVSVKSLSPTQIEVKIGNKSPIVLRFWSPVDTKSLKTRIARTSSYIEVEAPIAKIGDWVNHPDYMFPVYPLAASTKGQPLCLNMPRCHLPALPILDLAAPNENKFQWLNPHISMLFDAKETARKRNQDSTSLSSLTPSVNLPRYNVKDSLFSIFTHFSGLNGGRRTHLFGLDNKADGGVQILVLVSTMNIDLGAQSVVLDAAILPLRTAAMEKLVPVLMDLQTGDHGSLCQVIVDGEEMKLWKAALPAMVERCRTWKHRPSCEYAKAGKVPVSMDFGERLLCSCGEGVFPQGYGTDKFPKWSIAKKFATRAAIPLAFSVATVEKLTEI